MTKPRLARAAVSTIGASVALLAAASSASAATLHRVGTATARPRSARVIGTLAGSTELRLTVALSSRDASGLATYAEAVGDRSSARYHQYLSVAEFARRFGATPASIAAVRSTLRSEGLAVAAVGANGLSLEVSDPASTVARALHTQFERVRTGTRSAYLDTEAPEVPESIAHDVAAITGLQTVDVPQPLLARRAVDRGRTPPTSRSNSTSTAKAATACPSASDAADTTDNAGTLTIADIANDYDFDSLYSAGDLGSGVTVGVYELEANFPSDITAYQDCFGTDATVSYDEVDGGGGAASARDQDGIETELDVENIIGLAPDVHVIVYQGPDDGDGPYDVLEKMVSDDTAKVLSSSWGECEAGLGATDADAENTLYEEAAVQGQTVVAAAGDDGAEDCYGESDVDHGNSTATAVDDPASQPYVTGVGGTDIESSSPLEQSVWNNGASEIADGGGAGGGGDSTLWAMPSAQSSAASSLGVINGESSKTCDTDGADYCREVPDVSADADSINSPYLIYWDGDGSDTDEDAWIAVGGTSGAAPLWAALFALADDHDQCVSKSVGFANPALYRLAGTEQSSLFDDITSGDNDLLGTNDGQFAAAAGYDQASGLGTPKAAALVDALCPVGTISLTQPAAQSSHVGHGLRLALHASDSSGATLTYVATDLPAGLSLDAKTGVISGTPTQAGHQDASVAATTAGQTTVVRSFTWNVAGRPTVSNASIRRTERTHATLSLTARSGADAPALHEIKLTLPRHLTATSSLVRLRSAVTVRDAEGGQLGATITRSGSTIILRLAEATDEARVAIAATGLALPASARLDGHTPLDVTLIDAKGWTTHLTALAKS